MGYFIGDRTFQPSEVRLLVDAVQSSRFLTRKKSEALIRKLQTLVSRREAKEMGHNVYVAGRIKTMNESIYTNVDAIGAATRNGKKLRFRYFDWNTAGERVFRREGGYYTVSPFFLIWDDENYYLVAVEEESGEKRHFRVDKMVNLQPLEEDREGEALFEGHDPAEYEKRTFGMYGGKEERVTLWCHESLAGV
ncbi:MAG: WYL domain-containing protein, partial [Clostridia bacterium]|nr:WYL domain-containing protein [Clostridia bacterium]